MSNVVIGCLVIISIIFENKFIICKILQGNSANRNACISKTVRIDDLWKSFFKPWTINTNFYQTLHKTFLNAVKSRDNILSMGEITRNEKIHKCLFSLETSPKLFSFQRQYKKLENSMCVVSYSTDYVEKYHVPLAKSLMEYSNRKDLRIKRAIIREPENLNSIPPSKVCIDNLFCLFVNEFNLNLLTPFYKWLIDTISSFRE